MDAQAKEETLKIGNLCCKCAQAAGVAPVAMIRSLTEHWSTADYRNNDIQCRWCGELSDCQGWRGDRTVCALTSPGIWIMFRKHFSRW